jgi:hypothetical protein
MATIIYYAPPAYRTLQVDEREEVVGFRGPSHELIAVTGGSTSAERLKSAPAQGGVPVPPGVSLPPDLLLLQHRLNLLNTARSRRQQTTPMVLGNAIHLRDLDTGAKRDLTLEKSPEVLGVTSCASGNRIFVLYRENDWPIGNDCPIAVFDGQAGKSPLRTFESSGHYSVSASDDGKRLVYSEWGRIACTDVDTGQRVYSGDGMDPIISPDGKYLAMGMCFGAGTEGPVIIDLKTGRDIFRGSGTCLELSFSPQSDRLLYMPVNTKGSNLDIDILDIPSKKVVEHAPFGSILVKEGKQIASAEPVKGGLSLKFRDIETHRELLDRTIQLPKVFGNIERADRNGNLIRLDTVELQDRFTWLQTVLGWLGFKQPDEGLLQWYLVDVRSSQILDRGADELVAVSDDGRYAVSRKSAGSTLTLHEFPLHRSWLFMLAGAALWTLLALTGHRSWQRRLKPLIEDVSEPDPAIPSAPVPGMKSLVRRHWWWVAICILCALFVGWRLWLPRQAQPTKPAVHSDSVPATYIDRR